MAGRGSSLTRQEFVFLANLLIKYKCPTRLKTKRWTLASIIKLVNVLYEKKWNYTTNHKPREILREFSSSYKVIISYELFIKKSGMTDIIIHGSDGSSVTHSWRLSDGPDIDKEKLMSKLRIHEGVLDCFADTRGKDRKGNGNQGYMIFPFSSEKDSLDTALLEVRSGLEKILKMIPSEKELCHDS